MAVQTLTTTISMRHYIMTPNQLSRPQKPSYWQLVRALQDKIIKGTAKGENGYFLTARHIQDEFCVSPPTVQRAVGHLADLEILSHDNGKGWRISSRARDIILHHRRNLFKEELSHILREANLLELTNEDLDTMIEDYYRNPQ